MLTDDELGHLATDLESDRVERKESLAGGAKDKIGQAICAFANDLAGSGQSGVVMIGVTDDGRLTGRPVTDNMLKDLAAFRSDGNILPLPHLRVEKRALGGGEVAVVEVAPSGDPPVRYYGQVWVRVGPRRGIASRDEERVLAERRRAGDLPFDRCAARGTSIADLDLDLFRSVYLPSAVTPAVLEENDRTVDHQLAALHLTHPSGVPNYGALLLLGTDPRAWLPGAYVQFIRFDGTELDKPILDQKEISGRAGDILGQLDALINVNVRIRTTIEGSTTETRRPDYPVVAIQQLVRNAVLHRTYEVHAPSYVYWFSDRVEIHSPGGLYGRVNDKNFGDPGITDYRNPGLAEGLKILGFVQRFGWGVRTARERCQENGNPVPEFTFSTAAVLASVRSAP